MAMNIIQCKPILIPTVWAGSRLAEIRGYNPNAGIGIIREVCSYPGSENEIDTAQFKGMNLRQLITRHQKELMGEDNADHLLRVAYIDSNENLSVQVHPNDQQASKLGDFGKNECWYILDCDQDAQIIAGLLTEDKHLIREAIDEKSLEDYLVKLSVKPGDFAMIPAGLIHACGAGILALEIGTFGGITYRVFDFGRLRPLDVEKSIEIMDCSLHCDVMHFSNYSSETSRRTAVKHTDITVDILDVAGQFKFSTNSQYQILTCVENHCKIISDYDEIDLGYTKTLIVPACNSQIEISGNARLIICHR